MPGALKLDHSYKPRSLLFTPEKSWSWVAYFSDNRCENGSEADGWRPAGGDANLVECKLFGATVQSYAISPIRSVGTESFRFQTVKENH